jgi:hypothetical protein
MHPLPGRSPRMLPVGYHVQLARHGLIPRAAAPRGGGTFKHEIMEQVSES